MRRTRHRPLPAHRVGDREALVVGAGLGAAGFAWLWALVNLPAALLSTAALAFYVLVYSMVLKRSTPQNIVIGGAAGAVPALVGWAAVQKRVFDVVVGGLALAFAAPLMLVVGASIALTSGLPVFYRQERMGLDGHLFTMVKFRTMAPDAERGSGPV